jgi:Na+/H+ antiporter NhaD/arsenite permease-like protein
MDPVTVSVFLFVYLGMFLGEVPGLALDRTGIALVGAIVLVFSGRLSTDMAWRAVDVSTIALLLGLMVVSAQFRLGGFYTAVTRRLGGGAYGPAALLAVVIGVSGALAAVLVNDVVCLAMAPVLVEVCVRRKVDPVPFLLALACAANVGSAATLIGSPQNMLIGQTLDLSFGQYLIDGGVPAVIGLGVVWGVIWAGYRGRWHRALPTVEIDAPTFDRWQTLKGIAVTAAIIIAFLWSTWPRDVVALAAAGVLLMSRKMASGEMLGLVDWHLLLLFVALFVVNAATAQSGLAGGMLVLSRQVGADLTNPWALFGVTTVLSNLVSNVPAVMLLLPAARSDIAGPVLALSSTLAGNLLIVGSIANIIVVDQAARLGVAIDWRTHARVGIPVTLITLGIAALWLAARAS